MNTQTLIITYCIGFWSCVIVAVLTDSVFIRGGSIGVLIIFLIAFINEIIQADKNK